MRRAWQGALIVVSAWLGAPASAEDPPRPEQAIAERVLAAHRAQDAPALDALVQDRTLEPWSVADVLLEQGEGAAAAAVAQRVVSSDGERLRAYVAAPPEIEAARPLRQGVRKALGLMTQGDAAGALALVESLAPTGLGVAQARLALVRARTLAALGRRADVGPAFERAVQTASDLGWLALASNACYEGGAQLENLGEGERAFAFWERLEAFGLTMGNVTAQAASAGNRSMHLLRTGRLAEAVPLAERASALYEKSGFAPGVATMENNLGLVRQAQGDFEAALRHHGKAAEIHERSGDAAGAASALANVGTDHLHLGALGKALETLSAAEARWRALGAPADQAEVLFNQGLLHLQLGDLDRASAYVREARALYQGPAGALRRARLLGLEAHVARRRGRLAEAQRLYEQAFAASTSLRDAEGAATALGSLAGVHLDLGDGARALATTEQAIALAQSAGLGAHLAVARMNRAVSLQSLQRFDDAAEALEQAAAVAGAREAPLLRRRIHGLRAGAAEARGDLETALRETRAALEAARAGAVPNEVASELANEGDALLKLGRHPEASARLDEALRLVEQGGFAMHRVRLLWNQGRLRLAQGDARGAVDATERAAAELLLHSGGTSDEQLSASKESMADLFDFGVQAAIAAKDLERALSFVERGRATSLLEALRARESVESTLVPEGLRREETAARAEEAGAAAALARARGEGDVEARREARRRWEEARARRLELLQRLERESKAAADALGTAPATLEQMRGALRADEALVLYGLYAGQAGALVVTREGLRGVALGPAAPAEEAAQGLVGRPEEALDAARVERARGVLWDPLRLEAGVTRVLISPHGPLAQVPFALLAGAREVAFVPSGTAVVRMRGQRPAAGGGVLAFGAPETGASAPRLRPLPQMETEARAVGTLVRLGAQASESALRADLAAQQRWGAVHLACHGLLDLDRPALSALALAPSSEDDGQLTAGEVLTLRVPADLVVLSACDTARGKSLRAEGATGLMRAFLLAGAERVVCSLWKVDDAATGALMQRFHALWRPRDGSPGRPCGEALRLAQEHVRAQPAWAHPRFWAAWVIWGDPR